MNKIVEFSDFLIYKQAKLAKMEQNKKEKVKSIKKFCSKYLKEKKVNNKCN